MALPRATITVVNPYISTVTDTTGKYRIDNLKKGRYTLKVSYIGYQTITKSLFLNADTTSNFSLNQGTVLREEVNVSGTRAAKNSATTFTNLSKKDIQKNNLEQDLPFLLDQTPSLVTNSDAGAGIGYTVI